MRVHEVVRLSLGGGVLEKLRREFIEVLVHVHLRPVADRAGLNVDDPGIRTELLDPRVVLLAPASEDVDLDASRAEVARELAHVHVHPTGVAATELRQGTRMDRDHRDPSGHGRDASKRSSQ